MTRFLFWICIVLIGFTSRVVKAGEVVIKGNAPAYAGETISFYHSANPVLDEELPLGASQIDSTGFFRVTFQVQNPQKIFTHLGIYQPYMYVLPDHQYVIALPEKVEQTEQERLNPYFTETELHLYVKAVTDLTSGKTIDGGKGLNHRIKTFDELFRPHFEKVAQKSVHSDVDRAYIDSIIHQVMDDTFEEDSISPFFERYTNYKYGILERAGRKHREEQIARSYFANKPVQYFNPAYMKLFRQIFKRYFFQEISCNGEQYNIKSCINEGTLSFSQFYECLDEHSVLGTNDTVKDLVLLKNLYDGFYQSQLADTGLLRVLDSVRENTAIEFHRHIAEQIHEEVTSLMEGYTPPSLALYDRDSNRVRLRDYHGSYVYLNFCSLENYTCLRQFRLFSDLLDDFPEKLRIITILKAKSFASMTSFLKNHSYDWTFLYSGTEPEILQKYEIRSFPVYYLVGPSGHLIKSPANHPGRGFRKQFKHVLKRDSAKH